MRHEHVRRLMALEIGDSNNTTNVVVALDPDHALTSGKQKMSTLLLQTRAREKPVCVVSPRGGSVSAGEDAVAAAAAAAGGPTGKQSSAAALVAMMELATGSKKAARPDARKVFGGVAGRGCVKANLKFNQGHLFLVNEGFVFVDRPALFLPLDDVVRPDEGEGMLC